MELSAIYFSGELDSRFIVVDDDGGSYIIINATQVSSEELDGIEQWCRNHDETYYKAGIVGFQTRSSMTQFLLRWS